MYFLLHKQSKHEKGKYQFTKEYFVETSTSYKAGKGSLGFHLPLLGVLVKLQLFFRNVPFRFPRKHLCLMLSILLH